MFKKHLVALLLGLSVLISPAQSFATNPVGSLGTIPTITVGGTTLTRAGLIHLYVLGTAANTYMTFRQWSTSTGYQVSGGSLRILAGVFQCPNSNTTNMSIMYGDNNVDLGTTVPTNPVYPTGVSPATFGFGNVITMLTGTQPQENGKIDFLVPSGKYITLLGDTTCAEKADLFGYYE